MLVFNRIGHARAEFRRSKSAQSAGQSLTSTHSRRTGGPLPLDSARWHFTSRAVRSGSIVASERFIKGVNRGDRRCCGPAEHLVFPRR